MAMLNNQMVFVFLSPLTSHNCDDPSSPPDYKPATPARSSAAGAGQLLA